MRFNWAGRGLAPLVKLMPLSFSHPSPGISVVDDPTQHQDKKKIDSGIVFFVVIVS